MLTLTLLTGVVAGYLLRLRVPPYQLGLHTAASEVLSARGAGEPPHIGACPVFPADNVWNTVIDRLPTDARSEMYIDAIGRATRLHPSFGSSLNNGIPFSEVGRDAPFAHIGFEFDDASDHGLYPIPQDAPIEGGVASDGDRHVLLVDTQRCLLYELWHARPSAEGWQAGSGMIMDLTSNALRPDGWTSADAAGLPVLPGLVRYDEMLSGDIRHALRFTLPRSQDAYVWPARHKASHDTDHRLLPMGARLRLRGDFDITHFSRTDQVILTALKRYGILLADNGGPLFVTGVPDTRWDDADLRRLGAVTAADLEVVDESQLQLLQDSGRVKPLDRGTLQGPLKESHAAVGRADMK